MPSKNVKVRVGSLPRFTWGSRRRDATHVPPSKARAALRVARDSLKVVRLERRHVELRYEELGKYERWLMHTIRQLTQTVDGDG
jgi:hypothetical protein